MTGEPSDRARSGVLAPEHRATSIGLFLVITLVGFEALAIATVLPRVSRDLDGIGLYGWVFSAFLLASLLGIVLAGRLADRYGPERPFVLGLVLFCAGLVIGGVTPSMPILVLGRAVQGFGAGVIPAVLYVVIGRAYPSALQPRMFALMSTAWVLPSLFGPPIAALIAAALGWRWVFLALLPVVVVAGALAAPSMRHLRPLPTDPDAEPPAAPRDAVLVALGAGLLLGGLTAPRMVGVVGLVVVGLAVGVGAFRRLTPVGTLRARPGPPAAVLARGMLTFAFFGVDAFLTLAVQEVRGGGVALGGLALAAGGVSWTTASWTQQHLIHRVGAPRLVRIGFAVVALAIGLFSVALLPSVPIATFVLAWAVAGFGIGLAYAPVALVVLGAAEPGREGHASASIQLTDVLGCAIGIGVGGALVAWGERVGWDPASALHLGATIDLVVALGGVAIASRLRQPGAGIDAPVAAPAT
ncbi:MAG: MFS transporter [Actinomycetes bacterium]